MNEALYGTVREDVWPVACKSDVKRTGYGAAQATETRGDSTPPVLSRIRGESRGGTTPKQGAIQDDVREPAGRQAGRQDLGRRDSMITGV